MQLRGSVLALSPVSAQLLAVFIHVYMDIYIVRLSRRQAAAKRPVTKESVVRWYLGSTRRRIDGGRERNGKDEDWGKEKEREREMHTTIRVYTRIIDARIGVCIDP